MQLKEYGKQGEAWVANYLRNEGYAICATNYVQRGGEIDIIACKGEVITFVEVKMRKTAYFNISEVITTAKQRFIIRTAKRYIAEHKIYDKVFRFDVALLEAFGSQHTITYIPNAFTDESDF